MVYLVPNVDMDELDRRIDLEHVLAAALFLHPGLVFILDGAGVVFSDPEVGGLVLSMLDLFTANPEQDPMTLRGRVPVKPGGSLAMVLEKLAHAQALSHPDDYMDLDEARWIVESIKGEK